MTIPSKATRHVRTTHCLIARNNILNRAGHKVTKMWQSSCKRGTVKENIRLPLRTLRHRLLKHPAFPPKGENTPLLRDKINLWVHRRIHTTSVAQNRIRSVRHYIIFVLPFPHTSYDGRHTFPHLHQIPHVCVIARALPITALSITYAIMPHITPSAIEYEKGIIRTATKAGNPSPRLENPHCFPCSSLP